MSFWYLATPYSKYEGGHEEAFILAAKQAALLTNKRIPIFSPIVHSHSISMFGGADHLDYQLWLPQQIPLLQVCIGLIVVMADGWKESEGTKYEIDFMIKRDKPVVYMNVDKIPELFNR